MSKPVAVSSPGIIVPPDVAAVIAPSLQRELVRAHSVGASVHPDVAETIERIALLGDAYRNRRKTNETPNLSPLDSGHFDELEWTTAKDAAALLDRTPQAVTGRCRRGSLHAMKDGRTWRVCHQSITASLEGKTCRHV